MLIDQRKIQAHRGASKRYPENTLLAFRKAVEAGASSIETDLSLLADGQLCVFHDTQLKRTTNGKGNITSLTAADVAKLDAGSWKDKAFAGEPVPLLSEVLDFQAQTGVMFNWEIKIHADEAKAAVLALKKALSNTQQSLISSFNLKVLKHCAKQIPDVPRALISVRLPKNWHKLAEKLQLEGIHLHYKFLTAKNVAALKDEGLAVRVYTVNDNNEAARLISMGVDMIITDKPNKFLP